MTETRSDFLCQALEKAIFQLCALSKAGVTIDPVLQQRGCRG